MLKKQYRNDNIDHYWYFCYYHDYYYSPVAFEHNSELRLEINLLRLEWTTSLLRIATASSSLSSSSLEDDADDDEAITFEGDPKDD